MPLTMVPSPDYQKPRRGEKSRGLFIDGTKIEYVVAGCMSRGKEPVSANLEKLTSLFQHLISFHVVIWLL